MSKNNNSAVSESDTTASVEAPVVNKSQSGNESPKTAEKSFAYIGPPIPGGRLMTNAILNGTKEDIIGYYKDVVERFPNVEKLIVPVERLAESRTKIRSGGNVLSKYYNDLLNQIRQKGAVE